MENQELNFMAMDDREISNFSALSDIVNVLRNKVLTIIGVRQYASSTDGRVANRQILVGASYENAQAKDLAKLLRLSKSCTDIDSEFWFSETDTKNFNKMVEVAQRVHSLKVPDFSKFRREGVTENDLYEGWVEIIESIIEPSNRSSAQTNAYERICTGVYRHVTEQDRYYIRGFEISMQELSPAINPSNSSTNPRVLAKKSIKYGLDLMITKYRNLHLREDDTKLRLDGTELSIAMTAEKVREVIATNQEKKAKKVKAKKAKDKETATNK